MSAARTAATALLLGWGGVLLARPEAVVRAVCGGPVPPTSVVRVLGLRRLGQEALLLAAPSRTTGFVAAGTDVLHALTMLGAARIWPQYRRAALTSAAVAGISAALAGTTADRAGRPASGRLRLVASASKWS
jgi:hypothetical protein